jgi:hypothetical protein
MRFNAKKCHVMRPKRSRQNIVSINNYNIDGSTLEEVEHHPYLGVELGNDLNWNHHIDQTTTKAICLLKVGVFVAVIITANCNKTVTVLSSCRSCWSYDIGWYLESVDVAYAFVEVYQSLLYGALSANIKLMQLKWSNVELPAF